MPSIIDFLTVFAHPPQQRELGFSGFFSQTTLLYKHPQHTQLPAAQTAKIPQGPAVVALGRSGLQYQLCYNLKRVVLKEGTLKDPYYDQDWSIQQCEFHHQFDIVEGTMLWVSAKGGLNDYLDKVLELTGGAAGVPEDFEMGDRVQRFKGSLTVHLMNCHWAAEEWRNYISHLETAVEKEVKDYGFLRFRFYSNSFPDSTYNAWTMAEPRVYTQKAPDCPTIRRKSILSCHDIRV
jgi:hypothetical protein